MGGSKIKIDYNGQPANAENVEVKQSSERWNEYLVGDGSVLKMKLVLTNVIRVDGQYDSIGNPIYMVNSTNALSVNAPGELRDATGKGKTQGPRVRIPFDRKIVEAEVIEVAQAAEYWNDYLLEDGTKLKARLVVTNIHRVEGKHDSTGNPVYNVTSSNVVAAAAPAELRQHFDDTADEGRAGV